MNKKLITQASFWQGIFLVALPVLLMIGMFIVLTKVFTFSLIFAFIVTSLAFLGEVTFRKTNFLRQGPERRRFAGFLNFLTLIIISRITFRSYEVRHMSILSEMIIPAVFLIIVLFIRWLEQLDGKYNMFATSNGILCRTFAYMSMALIFSQIISLSYSYYATWNVLFPVSCILIFSELVKLYSLDLQRDKYLSRFYIGIAVCLFGLSMLFKLTH